MIGVASSRKRTRRVGFDDYAMANVEAGIPNVSSIDGVTTKMKELLCTLPVDSAAASLVSLLASPFGKHHM